MCLCPLAPACALRPCPGSARAQVLQTLSILIQNIKSPTAVFYLFSNDHLNDVVGLHFDFGDDEVLGYYINLLKAISMKFDASTIQFFFQARPATCPAAQCLGCLTCRARPCAALQEDRGADAFPFYAEAVKFLRHPDGLVRAAVRTLTLNVYAIPDPAIQRFVTSPPASAYFGEVASFMAAQAQACPADASAWCAPPSGASGGHACRRRSRLHWAWSNPPRAAPWRLPWASWRTPSPTAMTS